MILYKFKSSAMLMSLLFIISISVNAQEESEPSNYQQVLQKKENTRVANIKSKSSIFSWERLSISLGMGLRANMGELGKAITKDGALDIDRSTVASQFFGTTKMVMADRSNDVLKYNSANTASSFNLLSSSSQGGPLTGLDIGTSFQYDLDDILGLPFFGRTGFSYVFKAGGGRQSRTLGNVASGGSMQALLTANGISGDPYNGGTLSNEFNTSWMEIPFALGFRVPIKKGTEVYAGAGISWFSGGLSLQINADEKYVDALTTHADISTLTVTQYATDVGAISEKVEFKVSGLGINYFLGLSQYIDAGVSIFMELYASGTAKTVYSTAFSEDLSKAFTAASSDSLAGQDPQWFKRVAFPVVMRGGSVKIGARYYLPTNI